MRHTLFRSCAGLLALSAGLASPPLQASSSDARDAARGERSWAHVRILADDSMGGRWPGTPGHRRAAEYVAEQFRRAQLAPGGDDGSFMQKVELEARQIDEERSSLALLRGGGVEPLALGDDAILSLRGNYASRIEAPLIFLGYGLKLPQYGHDDLAGQDLRGKVVVAFTAAPKKVPGAAGAHFGSAAERWKVYRAAGAVGVVFIANPHSMDLPWERVASRRFEPFMAPADRVDDEFAGQQLWVQLNPARFALLLKGSSYAPEKLLAQLKDGEPLPRFELPAGVRATISARVSRLSAENVVGILPGSDPKLRAEHVVMSAHLDHLGVATQGDGDRIYNGAMDNASGIAVLMDVASQLSAQQRRDARSIAFVAVTAEESGLLGSRAFVTAARRERRIVANINTDLFLPLFPLRQLIVFGLEESDLGDDVRSVGKSLGVAIQSDPQPARNRFIRSDQYSFIRAGIPALALKVGFDADSPQADVERRWFAERYHAPSDEPDQAVDLAALGRYAELVQRLLVQVANRPQRPQWYSSSTFASLDRTDPNDLQPRAPD